MGVAELADAGILFPADPAGILFPADPTGMLFPADPAGILFPADPAGTVAADVAFLANADPVTMGVTDLADAGAVPLAAPDMTFPTIGLVTGTVTCELPCYDGWTCAELSVELELGRSPRGVRGSVTYPNEPCYSRRE